MLKIEMHHDSCFASWPSLICLTYSYPILMFNERQNIMALASHINLSSIIRHLLIVSFNNVNK